MITIEQEDAVTAAIRENIPLWMASDVSDDFIDEAARVMAMTAVNKLNEFQPRRRRRSWLTEHVEFHHLIFAMVLVLAIVALVFMIVRLSHNDGYYDGYRDGMEFMRDTWDLPG